jgi:serine/threonine protein phosphatase 1
MGVTIAVPDIHGRHDLMMDVLAKADVAYPEGGTVVFLGDYIDRGPSGKQVLDTLIAGSPDPKWKWIALRGNHEEIMAACWMGQAQPSWWEGNGGGPTWESFGMQRRKSYLLRDLIPRSYIEWIWALPLWHEDEHRVFVHAATDRTKPLEATDPEVLTWKLYGKTDAYGYRGKHVVHGHHAHAKNPRTWGARTALDTGVYVTGRLVAAVFDDARPGPPVAFLEAIGRPDFVVPETHYMDEE